MNLRGNQLRLFHFVGPIDLDHLRHGLCIAMGWGTADRGACHFRTSRPMKQKE